MVLKTGIPKTAGRMRIWFYARLSEPFSPLTVGRRGLGGSESALYYVARGLAKLGHEVVVLNHCGPEAGEYDGVRYMDLRGQAGQWRSLARRRPPDVLVLFRRMLDVLLPIRARLRVFWVHDFQGVSRDYPRTRLGRHLAIRWRQLSGPLWHRRLDAVVTVSRFLAEQCARLLGVPEEKLVVLPNGIDAGLFRDGLDQKRHSYRLVYTSVPERGLVQLLTEIFPAVRSAVSDSELHVFSYRPLEPYRTLAGPGVDLRGSLPKPQLARELTGCSLMAYPSNFEELGAIAVLEAMAAGVPAVTSDLGVLPELVGDGERGVVVRGLPGTRPFATAFADAVVRLLQSPERLETMRLAARRYVLENRSWDAIVRWWEQTLSERLAGAARAGP